MSADEPSTPRLIRIHEILGDLLRGRALRTAELARRFSVAECTVRRDLRSIDEHWDLETFVVDGLHYHALESDSVPVARKVAKTS